eukprot:4807005-Amphidinium_carterae.1
MIIDIYAQYNKEKQLRQSTAQTMNLPRHQNRFIMFMIQHHTTKITKIMEDAALPQQQINLAFGHFDERAPQPFTNPNVRNLADMDNVAQRMRVDRRLEHETIRIAT